MPFLPWLIPIGFFTAALGVSIPQVVLQRVKGIRTNTKRDVNGVQLAPEIMQVMDAMMSEASMEAMPSMLADRLWRYCTEANGNVRQVFSAPIAAAFENVTPISTWVAQNYGIVVLLIRHVICHSLLHM